MDISEILRAETENETCDTCTGLPCSKRTNCGFKRDVKIVAQKVYTSVTPCKYTRAQQRQKACDKNFGAARIPRIYLGKTFGDYSVDEGNQKAVGRANAAIAEGSGAYFYGECGCGKTFLAAIIAQELLRRGKTVIFGDVPSLLDDLKATFDGDDANLAELMANLAAADVLILDDLGAEDATSWAIERLYTIINQRYNAGKQIIVTSNFIPSVVEDKLNRPRNAPAGVHGSRIISRITQMCYFVKIDGGSRRRK